LAGFNIGIRAGAGVTTLAVRSNQQINNSSQVDDYVITTGAAAVQINDYTPRIYTHLPVNTTAINYSTFIIADSNTTTFNATITAGGSTGVGIAIASGGNWLFH
jgi:hypothetical protein